MITIHEKRDAIREACIKANPSIMDLENSVFIRNFTNTQDAQKWVNSFDNIKSVEMSPFHPDKVYGYPSVWIKIEILGRKIGLADVLLAIKERYMVGLLQTEGVLFKNGTEWLGEISWAWNLLLPFEEQSDELYDFLYQLLIQGEK